MLDIASIFFFSWSCRMACGALVLRPGIKPTYTALEAWSLNHWTTRKALPGDFYKDTYY